MTRAMQEGILRACRRFIDKQLASVEPRLKALEDRPVHAPVDQAELADLCRSMVADAVRGVSEGLTEKLHQSIKAIPLPKDGEDGKSVTVDDVMPLLKAHHAEWAIGFERNAQAVLQRAVDAMPKPKDGLDGFNLEDLQLEFDGERTATLSFSRGELRKTHAMRFPMVIDRGVYKTGQDYERGDGVTWGGNFWICQEDTSDKPGTSKAWRLAVKKGRDGKNV